MPTGAPGDGSLAGAGPPAAEARSPRACLARWIEGFRAGNPVLVKELRTRMRGARAFWVVSLYLGVLALIQLNVYHTIWRQSLESGIGITGLAARLGQTMFYALFCTQGALLALIAPAFTAGCISTEREQRSYDMLATSTLSPGAIVKGKLLAAVLFVLLLLTASLPLASLSLLFGGVSPAQILLSYVVLASTTLAFASLGVFWSALTPRTAAATAGAYVTALILFIGGLVPGMLSISRSFRAGLLDLPFQSINGAVAPARVLEPEAFFRWLLPSWVSALAANLLVAAFLAVVAAEQMECFRGRRPGLRRGLATALWSVAWLGILGAVVGYYYTSRGPSAAATHGRGEFPRDFVPLLIVALMALLALGPLLLTARGRDDPPTPDARGLAAADPRVWFSDRAGGGAGLLLLWASIPFLILIAGLAVVGRWPLILNSGVLLRAFAVTASVWFAMVGLGAFASAVYPRGWHGCALAYLLLLIFALLPYCAITSVDPTEAVPSSVRWQLAYLVPTEALRSLAFPHPPGMYGEAFRWDRMLCLRGLGPFWAVTSVVYLGLGTAALWAARARSRWTAVALDLGASPAVDATPVRGATAAVEAGDPGGAR